MRKKHPKQKPLPTQPITYRRIYTQDKREVLIAVIIGFFISLVGMNVFFTIRDLSPEFLIFNISFSVPKLFIGFLIFLGALFMLGALFGTLQSVIIDGENLVVTYRLKKNIYKASEVKSIDWVWYVSWSRNPIAHSQAYLRICIQNGKKVEIPGSPYSRVDMRKTLLDWLEKYSPADLEETAL